MSTMGSPGTWEVSFSPVVARRRGRRLNKKARAGSMGRVLPERSAATDRYGAVKETKPSRMEGEKSESADSTDEGGEPTRRDPLEESGRSD